jgi:membrane fusion protein (multidrug efflux system)
MTRRSLIKTIISLIVIICLIALGYVIYTHANNSSNKTHPHPKPEVTLTKLRKHSIPLTVSAYGYTISPHSVTLRAPVGGTIKAIHFSSGQQVKKGQLLFVIQASDVTQQLTYLAPQLITAKADYLRQAAVNKQQPGVIARQTLLKTKNTYLQLLAQYNQLHKQSYISAPVNGIISDTDLAAGDLISTNDTLAYISTQSILQLSYHLPSQWMRQLKLGQAVTFYLDDKQNYAAKVSYISPILSPNNQGIALRADILHKQGLNVNQFGHLTQVINPKQSLLAINQNLVQTDAKGYYLYGVQNNKIVKYYFMPGMVTKNGLIIIDSGIKAGTKIVNSNPSMLSEGQPVTVKR